MVLHDFPASAGVRAIRPRAEAEPDPGARKRHRHHPRSPASLAEGRRKPTLKYPPELTRTTIHAEVGPPTPQNYCDGVAYDIPCALLYDDAKSSITISDCELFMLRRPGQFACQDGVFVWLRQWHEIRYDGTALRGWMQGYVFGVQVTGLRRGG